jgi:hypothetical protein
LRTGSPQDDRRHPTSSARRKASTADEVKTAWRSASGSFPERRTTPRHASRRRSPPRRGVPSDSARRRPRLRLGEDSDVVAKIEEEMGEWREAAAAG